MEIVSHIIKTYLKHLEVFSLIYMQFNAAFCVWVCILRFVTVFFFFFFFQESKERFSKPFSKHRHSRQSHFSKSHSSRKYQRLSTWGESSGQVVVKIIWGGGGLGVGLVREEKPSKIVNWETWPLFRFWVLVKKILLLSLRETLSFSNRWLITFICLLRSASIRTYLTVCIKSQILNKDKWYKLTWYCTKFILLL